VAANEEKEAFMKETQCEKRNLKLKIEEKRRKWRYRRKYQWQYNGNIS